MTGQWDWTKSLFGIPFVLATLVIVPLVLMSVCGQVVVSSQGDEATIFSGIGSIGRRRRFRWRDVRAIGILQQPGAEGETHEWLQVTANKEYYFAWGISSARRRFMLQVLRRKWRGNLPG